MIPVLSGEYLHGKAAQISEPSHLQGYTGIYRNLQESTGIYRNLQEYAGIYMLEYAMVQPRQEGTWDDGLSHNSVTSVVNNDCPKCVQALFFHSFQHGYPVKVSSLV